MSNRKSTTVAWYLRLNPIARIAIAIGVAVTAWLLQPGNWPAEVRILTAWDCGATTLLVLAWFLVIHADARITRELNETQDTGRYVILILVVSASIASLGAIGFLNAGAQGLPFWTRTWHLALSTIALLLAWLLIQTVFGFHYAHRYYGGHHDTRLQRHGLKFPGDRDPDYLDFAYYSFVVGMTSQVSDVAITTRPMRRLTLMHGVLSFAFNVAIVAMSINVVGGALK